MPDDKTRMFSEITHLLISRAKSAESAARKGDARAAKMELSRTMVSLVNLFEILDDA